MRKQSVSSISYYYCTTPGLLCTLVQQRAQRDFITFEHPVPTPGVQVSMTSLLMNTVAYFTRPSFMSKSNNQPLKKFSSLAVSWVKVVINCKFLTFKVNSLSQKLSKSLVIFFIEEYHFRGTFFENFNFLTTLFSKMTSDFWQLLLNWPQDFKTF